MSVGKSAISERNNMLTVKKLECVLQAKEQANLPKSSVPGGLGGLAPQLLGVQGQEPPTHSLQMHGACLETTKSLLGCTTKKLEFMLQAKQPCAILEEVINSLQYSTSGVTTGGQGGACAPYIGQVSTGWPPHMEIVVLKNIL